MFKVCHFNKLQINNLPGIAVSLLSSKAETKVAIKDQDEDYNKQLKDFERISHITHKTRTKKPQKPPFAKNCFLGIFDTDILTFPQLEKSEADTIESESKRVENLLELSHMKNGTVFAKNFRQNLADYRAIGLQASSMLNGMEYNYSESFKYLEAFAKHKSKYELLSNEQLGAQTLIKFGSEELKKKYLVPLMAGEILSAFCLTEAIISDKNSMQTKAVWVDDKKTWVIDGEKILVLNGKLADILIVFAVTEIVQRDQIYDTKLTAFIVDKDSPGITYTTEDSKVLNLSKIKFNNTLVPSENVIGEVNKGSDVLSKIVSEFRITYGPTSSTIMQELVKKFTKHILDVTTDSNPLHTTEAIQTKLGEIVINLYAVESVTYLTTGLLDNYENQDCELESAVVKILSTEYAQNAALTCLDLIGSATVLDNHWCKQMLNEILTYSSLYETNDNLKINAALLGLQHAGQSLAETIIKLRNPLFHGPFIFKRMWTNRRNIDDNPKMDLNLSYYLHPSLINAANHLEYCVLRLKFVTETILARYGLDVVNRHEDLRRLAACIIDIYALTACLGRASRSYCLGIQHANHEIIMASAFSNYAKERVRENVRKVYEGYANTNDENYRLVAKNVFQYKSYFPFHSLHRNI